MHVILISGVFYVKYLLFIFDLILIFMRIFMCVYELLNWSWFGCFIVVLLVNLLKVYVVDPSIAEGISATTILSGG